ncbi:hypothetical protein TRAPUB_8262 [Trametes pubescens]|uniref:Uncharacterized protein n=1 Tax=Trametes pubescens TaxID=154538 RepID=A0A1M2W5N4_TRAPU|nr:hypothetical protein TRAPUB_8262 [Trametes pubescens]
MPREAPVLRYRDDDSHHSTPAGTWGMESGNGELLRGAPYMVLLHAHEEHRRYGDRCNPELRKMQGSRA